MEYIKKYGVALNFTGIPQITGAKRVSLISCRDIGHSSYTGIIFRIARLLRLRLPRCGAAVVLRHTKTSDMGGSRTGQYRVGCDQDALLP